MLCYDSQINILNIINRHCFHYDFFNPVISWNWKLGKGSNSCAGLKEVIA